jgi:hypothetical protein
MPRQPVLFLQNINLKTEMRLGQPALLGASGAPVVRTEESNTEEAALSVSLV